MFDKYVPMLPNIDVLPGFLLQIGSKCGLSFVNVKSKSPFCEQIREKVEMLSFCQNWIVPNVIGQKTGIFNKLSQMGTGTVGHVANK